MSDEPKHCPTCGAMLSPSDVQQGRCPACGRILTDKPAAGNEWQDRNAGGGMPPPPPPQGAGTYWGSGQMTPGGEPKGRNVPGIIAVICGLIAVVGIVVSGYCVVIISDVVGQEMESMMKEMEEKGEDMTQAEGQQISMEFQKRLQEKMPTELALSNLACPASVAGLAAIVLGIIGLCKKGCKRGMALLGLLLGIGSGLGGIIILAIFVLSIMSKVMQAAGNM